MSSNDRCHSTENQNAANYLFKERKVFNDPIHGQIEMHPVCVRIIDTPQFQRLRHIKQLDACYLVYPGASHNRFEHSIGTCHLAGKLMRTLQRRQPSEKIEDKDILCVEIAALCHDLGQGPFSHIFEKKFMPAMKKQFTHEGTARKMFEYILEDDRGKVKNDIQSIIRACQIPDFEEFTEQDFLFIKEMIDKPKDIDREPWPYKGRDENKSFMYEIVANKRNGIDVDKWDYLARDSYMLGMHINFEHSRCIANAKVLKGNGNSCSDDTNSNNEGDDGPRRRLVERKQICYRDKNAHDLYDMFYARMTLHRRAYQHKTHRIIGIMICEALIKANDTVRFQGIAGSFSIADAVDDMKAFTQLTDDVFQVILYSPTDIIPLQSSRIEAADRSVPSHVSPATNYASREERLENQRSEARALLRDILNRKLFKYVAGTQQKDGRIDEKMFKQTFLSEMQNTAVQENTDIYYDVIELDYGMKDKDPMEKVRFYKKDEDDHSIKIERNQVSFVLPDTFAENILAIYCKNEHESKAALIGCIQEKFHSWCLENNLPLPKKVLIKCPFCGLLPYNRIIAYERVKITSSNNRQRRKCIYNTLTTNHYYMDESEGSRPHDQDTIPKRLHTSDRITDERTEIQESCSEQRSNGEDLTNKRLPECNIGSENEEGKISPTIGGVDIRSLNTPDTLASENSND